MTVAVLAVFPDIRDVEKCRALEADLDEGRLHAGQHAGDATDVDVADEPARRRALDVELLHDALLEHRHPRFLRRYVDENLVTHGVATRSPESRSEPGRRPFRAAANPSRPSSCL